MKIKQADCFYYLWSCTRCDNFFNHLKIVLENFCENKLFVVFLNGSTCPSTSPFHKFRVRCLPAYHANKKKTTRPRQYVVLGDFRVVLRAHARNRRISPVSYHVLWKVLKSQCARETCWNECSWQSPVGLWFVRHGRPFRTFQSCLWRSAGAGPAGHLSRSVCPLFIFASIWRAEKFRLDGVVKSAIFQHR